MEDKTNDKPLVNFNEQGFVLNYSVTRNEEIAFIDYKANTITFKQMPLPLDKLKEIIDYYEKNRLDHQKYLGIKAKENKNENNDAKSSK